MTSLEMHPDAREVVRWTTSTAPERAGRLARILVGLRFPLFGMPR
ncbi:MAG: hypothetical protein ACRDRX_26500 [Pseudonocardiaceae bacterium]